MTIGAQEITRLSRGLRWMTGAVGAALTVYVTLTLFGYLRNLAALRRIHIRGDVNVRANQRARRLISA